MSENACCAELRKKLEDMEIELAIRIEVIKGQAESFNMKYGMMREGLGELEEERDGLLKQVDDLTLINASLVARREQEVHSKMCLKSDMRTLRQRMDCTYYDASPPGTIECPIDNPCETHKRERLENLLKKMRATHDKCVDNISMGDVRCDVCKEIDKYEAG